MELRLFITASQSVMREASPLLEYRHNIDRDAEDVLALIDAEIRRIESRRKVPLVPCRCGCKQIKQWRSQTYGYVYRCDDCDEGFEYRQTDKAARIAWNEAQKGGEQ